ncbi:Protein N-acetyltransferase, RimJ/RimL family [Sinosporangium album]|uniref:Protein N-acetyltransferase, RimJ/RimL family n=1 Tax=Sinosporangium album TaxID=504805 RepID=A0A1G7ZCX0_9ACTN|nr:GNAT family protein [Sinosporangium album]SDH06591.1 Protein N-acetyltransferase, RimJ/RimL family [Sinosporangium album]
MVLIAHLETRQVALQPAEAADGLSFYQLLLRLGLHSLPSMESFLKSFEERPETLAAVFAIRLRENGELLGFGSLQERDRAGHIQVGLFMETERVRRGVGAEAMMLLVNYAFAVWPELRKVYFLTTDASLPRFGSALLATPREASLPAHVFFRGRLWDLHFYAVGRGEWERVGARLLGRLAGVAGV